MSRHQVKGRSAVECGRGYVRWRMGKMVRVGRRWLLVGLSCGAWLTAYAEPAGTAQKVSPLLPQAFGSLHLTAPAWTEAGADAASGDPVHAALLREDGLTDAAQASYAGAHGAGVGVRAWRFSDATGAYAAYTAFREPQMRAESLGVGGGAEASSEASAEASSGANRYLFWTGSTLVEATLSHPDAHALGEMRALAGALPRPRGPAAVPPPIRGYLPTAGLEAESVHYAIGPAGYAASGSPLPESVIDFSRDAEVATARYRTRKETGNGTGFGTLTLINYPTPQIAGNRLQAITALLKSGAPPLTVGDPALVAERIGPLVAFTSGSLSADEAHTLIRGVHLDEVMTINHPEGYISEVSKAAKLLLGIAYMTGTLAVAAVLLALFLGGGRVLVRRMRGQPDSSMNDDDFISLKLR